MEFREQEISFKQYSTDLLEHFIFLYSVCTFQYYNMTKCRLFLALMLHQNIGPQHLLDLDCLLVQKPVMLFIHALIQFIYYIMLLLHLPIALFCFVYLLYYDFALFSASFPFPLLIFCLTNLPLTEQPFSNYSLWSFSWWIS